MKRTRSFTQALFAGALSLLLLSSCELGAPTKGGGTEGEGIVGALVDPSGDPMANVWVKAFPLTGTGDVSALGKPSAASSVVVDSVQTNAQGTYLFKNLPVGTYNLTASVTLNGTVYAVLIQGVVVSSTLTTLDDDTVKVSGSFTLHVTSNGQPVADAVCALNATSWVTLSDNEGKCTLTGLPPGTIQVIVSHPAFASAITQSLAILSGEETDGGVLSDGDVAAPAAPWLVSPGDVSVVPSSGTLRWTTSLNALTYHIQLGTDSTFASLIFNDSNLTDTIRGYGPMSGNGYFWRVRAKGAGGTSPWSIRGSFIISNGGTDTTPPVDSLPIPPTPSVTPTPQLESPLNGATGVEHYSALSWKRGTGSGYITKFRLQVALDTLFTTIVLDDSLSRPNGADSLGGTLNYTRYAPRLNPATRYFWRVTARGLASSSISEARSFVTASSSTFMPIGLSPITPTDAAVDVSLNPTLTWSHPVEGVVYRLQVATDPSFTNLIAQDSNLLTARYDLNNLAPGQTYYWRVSSRIPDGLAIWGAPYRSFTTLIPTVANTPSQLVAPVSGDSIATSSILFRWTKINGATNYQIQVATDSSFTVGSLRVEDSTITDSLHSIVTPGFGGRFFWRVRAINATTSVIGPWSYLYSFITVASATPPDSTPVPPPDSIPLPPPAPPAIVPPTLGSPAHAATVTTTPLLEWSPVSDAVNYRVEVALDSLFMSSVISDSVPVSAAATPPKHVVGPLNPSTQYFWRIRAEKVGAVSAWSSIRYFRTED